MFDKFAWRSCIITYKLKEETEFVPMSLFIHKKKLPQKKKIQNGGLNKLTDDILIPTSFNNHAIHTKKNIIIATFKVS